MARKRQHRSVSSPRDRVGLRTRRARAEKSGPTLFDRLTAMFFGGIRQVVVADVRYKERDSTSLERALGPKGKGSKAFEVRFPAGRPMTINATESRRFADLMDVPAMRSLERAGRFVEPGQRILVLGSGTGAIAELVASWTGPHGAVVAFEHDHESVRYAKRRYNLASTSLERGGPELLAGEIKGSFDTVVVDQGWVQGCDQPGAAWEELWRVLAEPGRVIHLSSGRDHPADAPRVPAGVLVRGERIAPPEGAPAVLVLSREAPDAPSDPGS